MKSDFPKWIIALFYIMFFISGIAGLIYEIVWTRILSYVFGTGTYALSSVVVAYMAGLALGASKIGKKSDSYKNPLLVYVIIEFAIAFLGAILPFILPRLSIIDKLTYGIFGQNFIFQTAGRFISAILILIIPTFLMGATLPLLSKALVKSENHLGKRVSALYGTNTFGAVIGAIIAGFILIPKFGLYGAEYNAVILNCLASFIGLGIFLLIKKNKILDSNFNQSPQLESSKILPLEFDKPQKIVFIVLFASFISGFVSMGIQILWSRMLSFNYEFLSSTTYSYSALLGVYLAGLAIGSYIVLPVVDKCKEPFKVYGLFLSMLGISLFNSLITIYNGSLGNVFGNPLNFKTQTLNFPIAFLNLVFQTVITIGIPTLLMGMSFPVAVKTVASLSKIGSDVGKVYALNTLGAIIGIIVTTFLLIPLFGLTLSVEKLALLDLLLGIFILWKSSLKKIYTLEIAGIAFIICLGTTFFIPLKGDLRHSSTKNLKQVYYHEGPVATIAVYETPLGYRHVFVDHASVAGTSKSMLTDQKSLAHMPMMIVPNPKAVLTVGFGSGGTSYSFLRYKELEKVHCVEIASEIVKANPYLTASSHNFLKNRDPRYKIIFDDARAYLQYTSQSYDIISTDCTDLRYKSNANLYDLEYFQYAKARLNKDGVVVVWMPLGGLSDELFRLTLRTFYKVFPEMAVFYMNNVPTHYVLLVGWKDKMEFDFRLFVERLKDKDVKEDLAEINLENPYKMLSTFITGGEKLKKYIGEGEINTENNPILEFDAPSQGYSHEFVLTILDGLMQNRTTPLEWVKKGSMTYEEREKFLLFEKAMPFIIRGHFSAKQGNFQDSVKWYLKALAITPDDPSLPSILSYPELKGLAELGNIDALVEFAYCMSLQQKKDQAILSIEKNKYIKENHKKELLKKIEELTPILY